MTDVDEKYDNSLANLKEDPWVDSHVTETLNAFLEALYGAGCNINPTEILVSSVPGDIATINSDFGQVTIKGTDDE